MDVKVTNQPNIYINLKLQENLLMFLIVFMILLGIEMYLLAKIKLKLR